MTYKKKLIEVALPLNAINTESLRRKQKAPKGWPTTFHKWWAQRPLAAARGVIFAQMVDDPSAHPDLFPTEKQQVKERQRLFQIIEELVQWDNTDNYEVLQKAQDALWQSWRYACADYADHPRARELFDRQMLPAFHDPFAGGGSLPLSAQWLGLESYASDLNPVAVVINKALIDIPFRFSGNPAVNPDVRKGADLAGRNWARAQGMAADVRYYGRWMREEAEKRIGHLYPKIKVTAEMASERADLTPYIGRELTIIAWLWARTVKSPNPAFANTDIPLASTFVVSNKAGKEAYVEPVIEGGSYRFVVKAEKPAASSAAKEGTTAGKRAAFRCLMSGVPVTYDYIRVEGKGGRMGAKLMAIVAEGDRGRVYISPTHIQESIAKNVQPEWRPDNVLPVNPRDFKTPNYGLSTFADLFTNRQLVVLTTLSDLVAEAGDRAQRDAVAAGMADDRKSLEDDGVGAKAYADSISLYLACMIDRVAYYGSTLVGWLPKDSALGPSMPRQAVAMSWDYAEGNPFGKSSGDIATCSNAVTNFLDVAAPNAKGHAIQKDAQTGIGVSHGLVISTDPPYFDNIGYADLSDFFYVWLRRSLKNIYPSLFATLSVPKAEELVATQYRHGSKERAETFFLSGMTEVMHRLASQTHPAYPVTIYYAFKQTESDADEGTTNTGWDTFLAAVIQAGFAITGTWPIRTEGEGRMLAAGTNALASSIVLVCRPRAANAPTATRREFVAALKAELPQALAHLQAGNIAPVDLAQASIGPGMAVYTRYAKVLDAEGKPLSVRTALALINQTLDEALAEQEGDFDADTRWALTWFDQVGFAEGEFGVANTLAQAKNTGMDGLVQAGIIVSGRGNVRLLQPAELPADWDPTTDKRLTVWEMVHQLIRVLEDGGESAAAALVAKLGSKAETARELCYRLYTLCERKKRANEAMAYNGLVQSWPEITRLAREKPLASTSDTGDMFN